MLKPIFFSCCFLMLCCCQTLLASHGASIDGKLKYESDFKHFNYVSEDATKNGNLILHDIGSFDKTNPFSLKGTPPYGLEELVFEPLAVSSLDEPFALYGLLAEKIVLADDTLSVTFFLNSKARFGDGTPVTAEDVGYTIDTFKGDLVHPYYNYYYQDISGYEILEERTIKVKFSQANRELHLICAQMRILPKKLENSGFWQGSGKTEGLYVPVGSGPYSIDSIQSGKSIRYKRNKNYWAADHPTRKGMYNYDNITVKYFKDQIVALEAFKAGEFDFISINIAKQWARDMSGTKFETGNLIKKIYPHSNNAGMQGFVMNSRRILFSDRRVRKALGLAFDFQWTNRSLFHKQYTRNNSFFSNSTLAASGLPEGLELELLEKFKDSLPPEVFTEKLSAPVVVGKKGLRHNLLEARRLLKDAGWDIKNGSLVNRKNEKFIFDILLASPTFERVMAPYVKNLKKLGIKANYRTTDSALYVDRVKKFDFDMIVATFGQSQSPGNEQRSFWHSSSADTIGSRNYAGIRSNAVDYLVEEVIYAKNRQTLTAACKALDRVLWYGYYLVPNWYLAVHRLAYNTTFIKPAELPLYYTPWDLLMTWWKK